MPLPKFESFRTVWVEKTKASHGHGGLGWEFGSCLWSPTTDKLGKRIYRNMTSTQDGDLVLHFYEDAPYGRETDHYFCGVSLIGGPVLIEEHEPPLAGEWSGRGRYYKVPLRDFKPLSDPLPLRKFARQYNSEIIELVKQNGDHPFINYNEHARLAQGKYLSLCVRDLHELLSKTIEEGIQIGNTQASNGRQGNKASSFDYEEYVEGQRAKREAWFFSRNPKLVRDAKEHYQFRCQACSFRYEDAYPGLGEGYIEIHHLNPLSERAKAAEDVKLNTLAHVTAMCANCHRMIHRLIRKLGRSVSIREFQELTGIASGTPKV